MKTFDWLVAVLAAAISSIDAATEAAWKNLEDFDCELVAAERALHESSCLHET